MLNETAVCKVQMNISWLKKKLCSFCQVIFELLSLVYIYIFQYWSFFFSFDFFERFFFVKYEEKE